MVSLIVHAILGVAVVVLVIRLNPHIFSRPPGPALSRAELAYYLVGLASIPICWYFNAQFIAQYAVPDGNPIWGPGSWTEFITLGYTNPAASSASADYTIANVVLLPLLRREPVHQLRVRIRLLLRDHGTPAPPPTCRGRGQLSGVNNAVQATTASSVISRT